MYCLEWFSQFSVQEVNEVEKDFQCEMISIMAEFDNSPLVS